MAWGLQQNFSDDLSRRKASSVFSHVRPRHGLIPPWQLWSQPVRDKSSSESLESWQDSGAALIKNSST